MKKLILHVSSVFLFILCCTQIIKAQNVGIGIAAPLQKLHIGGNANTIRIDGLSSTGTYAGQGVKNVYVTTSGDLTTIAPLAAPANPVDWTIFGNSGTTPANNFIGTIDLQDWVIKTGGNTATNERARFLSSGPFVVNNTTPFAGDVFSVYGTGYAGATNALGLSAINGYVGNQGTGVWGEVNSASHTGAASTGVFGAVTGTNTATGAASWGIYGLNVTIPITTGTVIGIQGDAESTTGSNVYAVEGTSASTDGIGIIGFSNTSGGAVATGLSAYGLYGQVNGTITGTGFAIGALGILTQASGDARGIQGQVSSTTGTGVIGIATNAGAGNSGDGIYGQTGAGQGFASWGINTNANGTGVAGAGNNSGVSFLGVGSGGAFSATLFGAIANATNVANGIGVIGWGNNAPVGTFYGGGAGGEFFGTGIGLYGVASTVANGTGVIGAGNNAGAVTLLGGGGGAFVGTTNGGYGKATTVASGTGIIGVGNNIITARVSTAGSGGAFTGSTFGVVGFANDSTNAAGTQAGGYFYIKSTGAAGGQAWCYTGARVGGTGYKTIGSGTNSTVVPDLNNKEVIMFCPEAPEVLFEDYGFGQLVNGQAHIVFDPIFAKNVSITADNPLRVFIQLEGNCNGVYVTNKTTTSFDVIELNNGASNTSFAYHIIGNRIDDHVYNSKFADLRFPPMIYKGDIVELPTTNTLEKNELPYSIKNGKDIQPLEPENQTLMQDEKIGQNKLR